MLLSEATLFKIGNHLSVQNEEKPMWTRNDHARIENGPCG